MSDTRKIERNLLVGTLITNMADSIFYIFTVWYFNEKFESTVLLALVFSSISIIDAFSFLFGPMIDRTTTKINLLLMSVCQVVLTAMLFVVLCLSNANDLFKGIALLILLVFTYTASSIIYPSGQKIIPMIAGEERLVKVNSVFKTCQKILDIFFNAISTVIIAFLHEKVIVAIILVLFLLAVRFYFYISKNFVENQADNKEDYSVKEYIIDLKDGALAIKDNKNILKLFLPITIVNFFYGIAIVVLPYVAKTYICNEAYGYGSLLVCSSLGGVVGTFLIGRVKEAMKHYKQITAWCLLIAGVSWIGMTWALDKQVVLSFVFIFISNMAICMMNIVFVVLIQKDIEEHLLGRVSTLTESMASIMIPAGNFVGGILLIYLNELYLEAVYGFALIVCSIAYFVMNSSKVKS
jgi:hypothetical protein